MAFATLSLLTLCIATDGPLQASWHATSGILELRLDRQSKLNALSPQLVDALQQEVNRASSESSIRGLLISSEPGRAFCAGGDIMEVADLSIPARKDFLRREYELMHSIQALQQQMPVIALADGIILGAGAGLFMAANVRIASKSTSFGMPECALGIVPDCGGTDFLQSLPGHLGPWMAMSGARLQSGCMAAAGLSTHACSDQAEAVQSLRERIVSSEGWQTLADFESRMIGEARDMWRSEARQSKAEIARLDAYARGVFASAPRAAAADVWWQGVRTSLEALVARSEATCDTATLEWATDVHAKLSRASPAALLLARECSELQLPTDAFERRAASLGVELAVNQALGARADFSEGVACAVGAKKGMWPSWEHASIAEAAADPEIKQLLDMVHSASPIA